MKIEVLKLYRTLSKAYSGYVHGASPHIMDMYGGNPPRFHTAGMLGTPRMAEHSDDLWNYMYRSFISHMTAAKVFGAEEQLKVMHEWKTVFEKNKGKNY